VEGQSVRAEFREVRDIDELALQRGEVNSRQFGELKIPLRDNLVQQLKQDPLDPEPPT
jgi:predicted polyphosphate/ATP-dependent NAD kinase